MGNVDSEISDFPLYALPVALVLALSAVPRGITMGKRAREWYAFMHRAPGDTRPGPGHFEVETIGSQPTNLGHSSETTKAPSGTPTLASEPAVLTIVGGPRIRLAPGAKVVIKSLAGAKRRTVDTTTTSTGIGNKISFEVPPGTRFWLECALVGGAAPPNAAYRDDVILETRPISDYVVSTTKPEARGVVAAAIVHAVLLALGGMVVGLLAAGMWRSGCRNTRGLPPLTELVDALCIAAVLATFGLHSGVASVLPSSATKMTKKDGVFVEK